MTIRGESMNIIDAVKQLYESSAAMAIILDRSFDEIWRNKAANISQTKLSSFLLDDSLPPMLPIYKEVICRHTSGSAAQIKPLIENDSIEGYLALIYDADTLCDLTSHSNQSSELKAVVNTLRTGMSKVISITDQLLSSQSDDDKIYKTIRTDMSWMMSSITNLSIYELAFLGRVSFSSQSLSDMLTATANTVSNYFRENYPCRLVTDICGSVFANVNVKLLDSAVLNLIINGYSYNSAANKEITLTLSKDEQNAFICVSDNGTNADLKKIERLSQYSQRVSMLGSFEGAGLALVRRVCELHKGSLNLEHSPTGGLCATIELPCLPAEARPVLRSNSVGIGNIPYEYPHYILLKGKWQIKK